MKTSIYGEPPDRPARLEPAPAGERPRGGWFMNAVVVAAIIIAGLYFARVVLEPFALAVLLSLLLAPAVRWLRHWRIGRVPAVILAVLFAFLVISGFAFAIGDEMIGLAQKLPEYEQNVAAKIRSLNGIPGAGLMSRVTRVFHDLNQEISSSSGRPGVLPPGAGAEPPVPVEIREPEPGPLLVLRDVVGPLLPPVLTGGLVALFVVLILLKREDMRDRLLRLAGSRDLPRTTAAMNEAAERVSRYLAMQLAVGVCYGLPVGIGLAVIGIPNAPLWGMLGVLMRFIPYVGGPFTAVFPVVLAIAVDPGWSLFLWTLLLFVGIETVIANFVEPLVYGRSTGLSSLAVVAAASFWTWLWGPIGLLLATPLTVCLVVIGRYVPDLQFLDVLLGNEPVLSPQESLYQRLLAGDPEEATEQAEDAAKETSIEAFFDEVAIPALTMAQSASDRGALSAQQRAVLAEGFATILDNLADDGLVEAEPEPPADASAPESIVCIAGRNELDLAAAWLLRHLLRLRGHSAVVYSPDAIGTFNLDLLPLRGTAVICLSLISTGSAARARYLVRRVRRRARRAYLLVGFWGQNGGRSLAEEARMATAADHIVSSLRDAVAAIEELLRERQGPGAEKTPDKIARQSA